MKYYELKEKQQDEVNNFPMFFAFNQQQFEEGLEKFNATKNDLIAIPGGGFILKKDNKRFLDLFTRRSEELQKYIDSDVDGSGFVREMFYYELNNHEYCYSYDLEGILKVLYLTVKEVESDKKLKNGLRLAMQDYQPIIQNR